MSTQKKEKFEPEFLIASLAILRYARDSRFAFFKRLLQLFRNEKAGLWLGLRIGR